MTTQRQISSTESDYDKFVAELTQITRKYGVAIQSVGGVIIANHHGDFSDFSDVSYIADFTSGDLYPVFPGCE